jgi:hypothetical protein
MLPVNDGETNPLTAPSCVPTSPLMIALTPFATPPAPVKASKEVSIP